MTFRSDVGKRLFRALRRVFPVPESYPDPISLDPFQTWLAGFAGCSCVHPSLEVTGQPGGFRCVEIGTEAILERDVTIWISPDEGAAPCLRLGERIFIGRNTYVGVYQPVEIGRETMIGAYCYIISASHTFERRDVPMRDQGFTGAPVMIGDDVWLGTHVVVLPGVTIGRGAIVAAGSIVNGDIPPYEIWGGAPARFLKQRPA